MLAILGLLFLVPLRGMLRAIGPPMEEGFMLTFPERVLHGAIPNKDFLHLYGPGSLWVLAGVYKVFGTRLVVERLFALLQLIGIVLGVFGLARAWGRTAALCCASIALVIILPSIGLTALAWVGGVALGLLGLLAVLTGRKRLTAGASSALGWALAGGIVTGFALLYRLDLVVAVGLGLLAACWGTSRRFKLRTAVGVVIGAAAYVIHIVTAGPYTVFKGMVIDPVFNLRGGRRLPIPPPWGHLDGYLQKSGATVKSEWPLPALTTSAQLFVWFFLLLGGVAFLLAVAVWAVRRDRERLAARVLLAVALFSVGMLPQGLQRVDSAHFAWVSCVPFAFLPVAVLEIWRARSPASGRSIRGPALVTGLGTLLVVVLVVPTFTGWAYSDYVAQTFNHHRTAFNITHDGRTFYYGRQDVADAANAMLARSPRSRSRATGCSSAPPTSARPPSPTRTSTTCCRSTRPRPITSRWTPASPTPRGRASRRTCAPRTSRSSRASGSTGTSRTTPARSAPTGRTASSRGTSAWSAPTAPTRDGRCTSCSPAGPRADPAHPGPQRRARPAPDPRLPAPALRSGHRAQVLPRIRCFSPSAGRSIRNQLAVAIGIVAASVIATTSSA